MKFRNYLPIGLTFLRLALGPLALFCAFKHQSRFWFLPIMIIALLSDIYDGVLARRFGIATEKLRRFDSLTDIIYYGFILWAAGLIAGKLLLDHWPWIALALGTELFCLSYALIKFRKVASAHSYLAKTFGLMLFVGLTAILCIGGPAWIVPVLSLMCVLMNAEIVLMMLWLNAAPVDVLSIFHLRRGKTAACGIDVTALKQLQQRGQNERIYADDRLSCSGKSPHQS